MTFLSREGAEEMDFKRNRGAWKVIALALLATVSVGCSKKGPVEPAAATSPSPGSESKSGAAVDSAVAQASYQSEVPGLDISWVTDEYFAALILHPRQILSKVPLQGESRAWVDAAAADLGLSLDDVEQLTLLVGPPEPGAAAAPGASLSTCWIFRFSTAAEQKRMVEQFVGEGGREQARHQGRVYYKDEAAPVALGTPDDKTVLFASERDVKKALESARAHSVLLTRLGAVAGRPDVVGAVNAAPLRSLLRRALNERTGEPAPPWARQLAEITRHLKEGTLTADLAEAPLARLTLDAEDSQAALQLDELAQGYRGAGSLMLTALESQWARGEEGRDFAPLFALASEALSRVKITRQVRQVTVEAEAPPALADLPRLVEAAFVASMRGGLRQERVRRLQLVGLALHNHHVAQGSFPAGASRDAAGRQLLSWRVHLLPWLGQKELYDQFRLDQPWDSPHNRALLDKIPAVYQSPGAAVDGTTRLVPMIGPGTPFSLSQGAALRDMIDGPDNTILLVECGPDRAVPWTMPDETTFDSQDPVAALGAIEEAGFLALFGDGRVEIIAPRITPEEFAALLTHAGGEKTGTH